MHIHKPMIYMNLSTLELRINGKPQTGNLTSISIKQEVDLTLQVLGLAQSLEDTNLTGKGMIKA